MEKNTAEYIEYINLAAHDLFSSLFCSSSFSEELAVDHLADAVNGAYDCAAQNGLIEKVEDINEVIPTMIEKQNF